MKHNPASSPARPAEASLSLAGAARQLGVEARMLGNLARQHGLFVPLGRDLVLTQAHLQSLQVLLESRARAEKQADDRKKRQASTFGFHESKEMRKQRRRARKRQASRQEQSAT